MFDFYNAKKKKKLIFWFFYINFSSFLNSFELNLLIMCKIQFETI